MAVKELIFRSKTNILHFLCIYCLISQVICQELIVTHAPKYVTFQQQADNLQTSDVSKVITHTLGVPTEDVKWSGVTQGSLFNRPKANVLMTVVTAEGKKPLSVKNIAKYPVKSDIPSVDVGQMMNVIQDTFFDTNPLMIDTGVDNNFFDVHTDFDVFRKLPDTMRRMADRLLDSDSVLNQHTVGTLNSSHPTDLKLMGELQMVQDVVNTISDKPEMMSTKSPDLFSFTVTGLRDIMDKHGSQSTQAADASDLVNNFINKMTEDFKKLYKDNVMIEVLTIVPEKAGYVRKVRSLKADPTPTPGPDNSMKELNLSKDYDEDYPAIFNIILWFMIILAIVLFSVSYGMWHMDPGRDSIIYRMTTTRLKKD
ncbi:ATP6AP2 [Mytilus coruscus]|uniref:ATP6AP2 n=1 Tax=Mytilus coruscus TaxID=42192 RepID=A0A6J8DD11_MYTCO|nr:ATP6AP2 [Mytilus coruscus]